MTALLRGGRRCPATLCHILSSLTPGHTANCWRREGGQSTSPRTTLPTRASHSFCSMMNTIATSDRCFESFGQGFGGWTPDPFLLAEIREGEAGREGFEPQRCQESAGRFGPFPLSERHPS
jgi:hypothetical protein